MNNINFDYSKESYWKYIYSCITDSIDYSYITPTERIDYAYMDVIVKYTENILKVPLNNRMDYMKNYKLICEYVHEDCLEDERYEVCEVAKRLRSFILKSK